MHFVNLNCSLKTGKKVTLLASSTVLMVKLPAFNFNIFIKPTCIIYTNKLVFCIFYTQNKFPRYIFRYTFPLLVVSRNKNLLCLAGILLCPNKTCFCYFTEPRERANQKHS